MAANASETDVKAYAATYVLRCLLNELDARQPGLIDAVRAGVEADQAASTGGTGTPAEAVFAEALRLLGR